MVQGKGFNFSASPTASYLCLRTMLAKAVVYRLLLANMDVTNCFQNTMIPLYKRSWINAPVRYLQWFKNRYPDIEVETSPKYVLQTMCGMQGTKDAGRGWYLQLKDILVTDYGM